MIAKDVSDRVASLMNDTNKTVYTFIVVRPYLNMALDELAEEFALYNNTVTNEVSALIPVMAGTHGIGALGEPPLPTGLIEVRAVHERAYGGNDSFIKLTRYEYLPKISGLGSVLGSWAWMGGTIRFNPSSSNRDVLIDYIKSLFFEITNENDEIELINARSFLTYRTGALCAQFIGENKSRADELNVYAQMAMDRALGTNVKGRQDVPTRRLPRVR